jgi:hypothetical protein
MAVIYVGQQAWEQMGPPPAAPKAKPSSRARSKALRGARTARGTRKATARKATARKASTAKAAKARKATARKASVRNTSARKTSTKRVRGGALRPAAVTSTGPSTCARPLLSAARGRMEADDAVAKTAAEGFAPGSVIFLDIERMERVPEAMREYYRAWTARVLEDGRYRPGYYAHKHNAERIYADVKAEYRAAGRKGEPPFWIASGRGFSPDKAPHEVGHAFAAVWQGVLDKFETRNGVRLPIDVNVAAVPSPSSHLYASAE